MHWERARRQRAAPVRERLEHSLDLFLARDEREEVACRLLEVQPPDHLDHLVHIGGDCALRVRDLDGERAPLKHGDRDAGIWVVRTKEAGECLGVNRRTSHNDPQVRAPAADLAQQTHYQVRVRVALVRLVHHHHAVPAQQWVPHALAEQHAGSQVLEPGARRMGAVLEADRVPHLLAQTRARLVRDARRD